MILRAMEKNLSKLQLPCLQNGTEIIKELFHRVLVRIREVTHKELNRIPTSIDITNYHYFEIKGGKSTLV